MKDITKNNYFRIAIGTLALLLVPLFLSFTGGVNWGIEDFIAIGVLIFGTGALYEFISKRLNKKYRLFVGLALLGIFFLIWAELAVDLVSQILSGEIWMRFNM